MLKLLNYLKKNLFFVYVSFLLMFVPLYPKLPLFDLIPGYIVRVRIEDFLILLAVLTIFFSNLKSRFKNMRTPLDKPVVIYLIIGFLSMLSALFITKTVFFEPLHSGKMFIHWLRRIEYFSIFYIFYLSIKNMKQVKFLLILFFIALVGVNIYGFGQKYIEWPAFSTMNREFSKGWRLVLTNNARVMSTFGGHYDLAAYLVMSLLLSASVFFSLKNKILKIVSLLIYISSIFLMILTASRTSFIAYIVGLLILLLIWGIRKKNFLWSISRGFLMFYLSFFILLSFGDLSQRFVQIMGVDQIWRLVGVVREPFKVKVPDHLTLQQELSLVAVSSDVPPKIINNKNISTKSTLPPDVNKDIPEKMITTYTIDKKTGKKIATQTAVARRYSDAAFEVGLSGAIRLDALWPRAIAGFKKNPLLGTGYSTLTKTSVAEFTEAESTDNDYLRALGETGLLGFLSFFAIIVSTLRLVFRRLKDAHHFEFFLYAAYIAGTIGLLVNAIYIDVFEASKVAFVFWFLTAVVLKTIALNTVGKKNV